MNDRQERGGNSGQPAQERFRLQIDEKDLATGQLNVPGRRKAQSPYGGGPGSDKGYMTEKERREEAKAHKKRDKLKARKNKRIFSLVWLCMVVLVSLTLASYLIKGSNDFLAVGRPEGTTTVTIPDTGITDVDQLAQLLYDSGAIDQPQFFSLYCKVKSMDQADFDLIDTGDYTLATNLDYEDLINTLQSGNVILEEVNVTIPEGYNVLEIAAELEKNEVCDAQEFLDSFYKNDDLDMVIGKMLNNFHEKMSEDIREQINASGMTMDQVINLASIIQNEAANASDMYMVSAVLHNRLDWGAEAGIYTLGCDSTMFYPYRNAAAVPETGALSYGNYNTYELQGLPPGPISNPGMDAIMAALKPSAEGSSYLYFCHAADGTAYYASNEYDHLYNRQLAGLD